MILTIYLIGAIVAFIIFWYTIYKSGGVDFFLYGGKFVFTMMFIITALSWVSVLDSCYEIYKNKK